MWPNPIFNVYNIFSKYILKKIAHMAINWTYLFADHL